MAVAKKTVLALLLAGPALAGCHSIFGRSLAVETSPQSAPAETQPDYGAAQVAEGRKALDEGQLAAAVAAFRNAKAFPDQAAAASNGLAVAYAELGRPDLAERYFRDAVALAPADRRYQANLQRFYRANPVDTPQMAMAVTTAAPAPVASPVPGIQVVSRDSSRGGLTVSQPVSRLVRLSAHEVRIGSAPPAHAVTPSRRTAVAVAAKRPASAGAYPVIVSIAPRGPAPAERKSGYPIRVELQAR